MLPTIDWEDGEVVMIDQRKLPSREVYVRCRTGRDVAKAIRTMVIRGAPAIGVAAAMGVSLELRRSTATGTTQQATEFYRTCDLLAATGPTAVNLFWAIERMKGVFAAAMRAGQSTDELKATIDAEAARVHDEDVANCRALGRHGAAVLPDDGRVLTHCNAGALATGGFGSALGVVRAAVEAGKRVAVYAGETRPFLQGARLTAWELVRDGIETTVITDGMVGALMQSGRVDVVVVGADRIAANGDVANKIGTYTVAVLAREHEVPFYVAAPVSTIDLSTPDGSGIPIEERAAKEVTHLGGLQLTPDGAKIWNPAFDVTPARFVAGIITEHGICRPPFTESLQAVCSQEPGGTQQSAAAKASADPPKLVARSRSPSEGGEAKEV